MKNILYLFIFLLSYFSNSQTNFSVSKTPLELRKNANSVTVFNNIEIDVSQPKLLIENHHSAITVFNKKGEIEISNITFSDFKELYKPISLKYNFVSKDVAEKIGKKLYVSPMLFMGLTKSPFTLEERKYPIDYEDSRKSRKIINISIPEGYEVEVLPESTSFGFADNLGAFKYNISNTNGKIQVSTEFSINQSFIDSSDYKNLKGFYQLMIEKQKEKVVLKKI